MRLDHPNILPECYVDTNLIEYLMHGTVSHQQGCNQVVGTLKRRFSDRFAVGVIANFISITLFPQENIHFSLDAMPQYKALLKPEHYNSFVPLSYENLFAEMETILNLEQKDEWIAYLKRRYLFNVFENVR